MSRSRFQQVVLARRGDLIAERDPLRPSGRLMRQGGMDASYIDLADPSHLEFDYLRWIRIALAAAHARRVLHVGGGACALPRALAATDPGGLQQVCETDGDVLAMAREYFGLRRAPGLRVRHVEGREFLARQASSSFDAIVIDAFVGAALPAGLVTTEALLDAARVAQLALVNVIDDRSARTVGSVAASLATAYPHVWSITGRGSNTVLVGGGLAADALDRIGARVAGDASPARLRSL
jgi:hypothetical protein